MRACLYFSVIIKTFIKMELKLMSNVRGKSAPKKWLFYFERGLNCFCSFEILALMETD